MTETISLLTASEAIQLPTGYAVVMKNIIPKLMDKGYEIHHMAWQHIGDPIQISPDDGKHLFYQCSGGNIEMFDERFPEYFERWVKQFNPDVILSLVDFWFTFKMIDSSNQLQVPYVNYFPQDCDPFYQDWVNNLKDCHTPLAMSEFGRDAVKKAVSKTNGGWTRHFNMDVLYHGVDHKTFYPLSKMQKKDIKSQVVKDVDAFCFGVVGKNTDRKQHPRVMEAYKLFKEMNPGANSRLLMKTGNPVSLSFQGHDLWTHARDIGILNDVVWLDTQKDFVAGVKEDVLSKYYNIMDLYVSGTSGEGFGLPTLEAMACQTPVAITDYSTSRELVDDSGYLVPFNTMITGGMFNARRAMINVEELAKTMDFAYNNPKDLNEKARKAHERSKLFHWDSIVDQLDKILKTSIEVGF